MQKLKILHHFHVYDCQRPLPQRFKIEFTETNDGKVFVASLISWVHLYLKILKAGNEKPY